MYLLYNTSKRVSICFDGKFAANTRIDRINIVPSIVHEITAHECWLSHRHSQSQRWLLFVRKALYIAIVGKVGVDC